MHKKFLKLFIYNKNLIDSLEKKLFIFTVCKQINQIARNAGKNSITQLTLVEIVLTITFSTGESIVGIFDRKW